MTTTNPPSRGEDHVDPQPDGLDAVLRELAEREEAPAELDRLLEPLRLQDSQAPRVRPLFRWAALAAAILAGVYWLPDRARQAGGPAPSTPATRAQHEPGRHYHLQPLPEGNPETQPRTAAEAFQRLEPPARLPTPAPLEVMGPAEGNPEEEGSTTRPWRLRVAGRNYELAAPSALHATSLDLVLNVKNGRIISAEAAAGAPIKPAILEALVPLSLENIPDGRIPAHLSPLPASERPTTDSSGH